MLSATYILIPLAPLLASIVIALAGGRLREKSRMVAIGAVGISFGVSVGAFVEVLLRGEPIRIALYEWLRCGELVVDFGLYLDQLSVLLLLLVTGVGLVVHVYSGRYMIGDARYGRFFAVTTLFTFGMVALVTSSNLMMLFMSWEIMGICSYLLISHQSDRPAACKAATKAFLVNAVADVGLLFGIVLTYVTFRTLDIQLILDQAAAMSGQTVNLLSWTGYELQVRTVTLIAFFLFIGCLGKSAQMPFHVWLPNAMEAPTPVSALIHAATMVNAGPFLLVRFSALLMLSPVAMTVIAVVGGTTALLAAIISLTQSDIKKVLAYSTISQIGFMVMACGVGAFVAAIFHMLAHGCLKGFLFLSTGNQLEAVGSHAHHNDSEPSKPSWSLYLGVLILACVPPLVIFSGPYEKLWAVHNSGAARAAFVVIGLLTVFFTAIYLFRGVTSLFHSPPGQSVSPRFYSPAHIAAIAVGATGLVAALIGVWIWFAPFLAPALRAPDTPGIGVWQPGKWALVPTWPLIAAAAGWLVALLLHLNSKPLHLAQTSWAKALYVMFLNKLYFDELYSVFLVNPVVQFSRWLWRVIDVQGINGLIHGSAAASIGIANWMWRVVDVRGIDAATVEGGHRSVGFARWLWQIIDVRAIDRTVEGTGGKSVGLARWLWEVVDVRRIDKSSDQIGRTADATSRKLQDVEPRSLQHHLLVLVVWLVVAIVFFYRITL